MEKTGINYRQAWADRIAQQFRRAWNGQLPFEDFTQLFQPSLVFHYQHRQMRGIDAYRDFVQEAKRVTVDLDVADETVLARGDLVLLYFRWSSGRWHHDIVGGGRWSNYCKVVFRVEGEKIAELWQQAPDFLYLLGKQPLTGVMHYPSVVNEKILIEDEGGVYPTDDSHTVMMSELFKRMNDCFLGHSSLRNMKDIQNEDMVFHNGGTQGTGVQAWKTFAYALHTSLGSTRPRRFDDLYIRSGKYLRVFLRANAEQRSPSILDCANGLVASLKFEERNGKIQTLLTHVENYIPFLDTDFSRHPIRLQNLFHGRREPVVEPSETPPPQTVGKSMPVIRAASAVETRDVAIVGIAGRFPGCNSVAEYWDALIAKKNLFSEIGSRRPYLAQGTKIRHAGLIDGVDLFDAPFFQVLPSEAEYIDPQQRLLLEEIVHSIEDSGHVSGDYAGPRTGLFIATLSEDYKKLLQSKGHILSPLSWGGNEMAIFPARIARFLNIQGPCHYVNAECASSLVAIHEASRLIREGTIDQAIVGATNLFLHPYGFAVREDSLLTTEPLPRLFSKDSRGQLRAEAIVSVILKALPAALADGDRIYGIVAGSAVNNSGRTLSLVAGNVEQQANVMREAWRRAGVTPADVSLIECHASGVRGGDFAEVAAIKQALKGTAEEADDKTICHLASVKGAIGHAEAASGLTALVKLLLQLRHERIVEIQGLEQPDPELRLASSRLRLVDATTPWRRADSDSAPRPRIAGINAFAAGGYNAHVVIREYLPTASPVASHEPASLCLVVLSAQTESSLEAQIKNIRGYVQAHPDVALSDLAYSLQQGRDAMKYRVAFLARNIEELIEQLDAVLAHRPLSSGVFVGKRSGRGASAANSADVGARIEKAMRENDLRTLAEFWSQGHDILWALLTDRAVKRQRLPDLPLYPFDRKRYWIADANVDVAPSSGAATIHPLLHRNASTFYQQRYRTRFSGNETVLTDHVVQGHRVLPGVAYLEMIRAAIGDALCEPAEGDEAVARHVTLRHVAWIQPLIVDGKNPPPLDVQVDLFPLSSPVQGADNSPFSAVRFEVHSGSGNGRRLHCQGHALLRPKSDVPSFDLTALQAACRETEIPAAQVYAAYESVGLVYGPAYRGVESLCVGCGANGARQVLAKLSLPSSAPTPSAYVLHPSLMDAAVQAAIGLALDGGAFAKHRKPPLPFALEELEIHRPCSSAMWAWIRLSSALGESTDEAASARVQKIDIDLIDAAGNLCVRLARLSSRTGDERERQAPVRTSRPVIADGVAADELQEKVLGFLKSIVAKILQVEPQHIDIEEELNEYGFDSINLTTLGNQLNEEYQLPVDRPLNPTIFFEYPTLKSFSRFLVKEYREVLNTKYAGSVSQPSPSRHIGEEAISAAGDYHRERVLRFAPPAMPVTVVARSRENDIAIVGISARFPMAENVETFWRNLVSGKDCITEIPPDRWDWHGVYGDPAKEPNKTNIKWGGFIDGIGDFDPLFFGISPREAELMDPQQRLLMLHIWQAIEDAGYSAQSLSGTRTGIFVATAASGYGALLSQANVPIEGSTATGTVPSVGPNRMSHFLNLHGPSEAIETACSSSLVAIHRAIAAMETGSCDMAIVGGVNTIVTPDAHIGFSKAGMLCEDGRCKTFSRDANGYVRGEGVGILFLKRLGDAERSGDHIYGLIKGSAENHGGRSNSLTAPNPKAQAELLKTAYARAGVDPRSVGYIEAHGTGTELGDPIEINGVKAAFADLYLVTGDATVTDRHCGLGSVKSNIGHLELAAGVAGVIKVLLQLKHKTLVKSLHCEEINPYIQLQNTPFYIVQESREWKAPKDAQGRELPRRAGISSFGFGGANAHVVIEEYIAPASFDSQRHEGPFLVVLSARSRKQVQEAAERLLQASESFGERDMRDIAYTLQVGREAMDERLAMIVGSLAELRETLRSVVAGKEAVENLYRGSVKSHRDVFAALNADDDQRSTIDTWIEKRKYKKLLELWVKGLAIDWNRLYGEDLDRLGGPRRVSLPSYPFALERYWVPASNVRPIVASTAAALHPLVHVNVSDLKQQRYRSTFSGQEFFLKDHVVMQHRLLPAVTYLEMVRAAAQNALGKTVPGVMRLANVVWPQPIIVDAPTTVHVGLAVQGGDDIAFQVYTAAESDSAAAKVHCQGTVRASAVHSSTPLDLQVLREDCRRDTFDADRIYTAFRDLGMVYGPSHQGVRNVYVGQGESGRTEILAELRLPDVIGTSLHDYVLHPSLMDAALQACAGFMLAESTLRGNRAPLPFRVKEVDILAPCTATMWARVRPAPSAPERDNDAALQTFDIDVCDETGKVCVRMAGFSFRLLPSKSPLGPSDTSRQHTESLMLAPTWQPLPNESRGDDVPVPALSERLLIVGGSAEAVAALRRDYPHARTADRFSDELVSATETVDHIVWIATDDSPDMLASDRIIEDQDHGVLSLFRAVKRLLSLGYGTRKLGWTLVTTQAQAFQKHERLNPVHAGLIGFGGSLAKEYPHWKVRSVDLPQGWCGERADASPMREVFALPVGPGGNAWIYRDSRWYQQKLVPLGSLTRGRTGEGDSLYKVKGVYVVIGGAGGIGEVWSEYMIRTYQARVVWIGRKKKDAAIQGKIDRLAALGPAPQYVCADATQLESLQAAYRKIKTTHSRIHGIVHSAIVLKDQSVVNMDEASFRAVLSAKVDTSVRLAQVFRDETPDFVLFFSSLVAFAKPPGQSNYVAGCSFKDAFAHRLALEWSSSAVKTINWGFWGSVGVGASETIRQRMAQLGVGSIEPPEAMEALERLLREPLDQVALVNITKPLAELSSGIYSSFLQAPAREPAVDRRVPEPRVDSVASPASIDDHVIGTIKTILSEALKVSVDAIDVDEPFSGYGLDSITGVHLAQTLNQTFGVELDVTLFFDYNNVRSLAQYLLTHHRDALAPPALPDRSALALAMPESRTEPVALESGRFLAAATSSFPVDVVERDANPPDGVAIVGMSGCFPMANDVEALWRNVLEGKNCVGEVPKERWDWREVSGDPHREVNSACFKWGAFIDGVAEFDAAFFGISPEEARYMSPQQRLLMTHAWKAVEDAGVSPKELSKRSTGVFIATVPSEYLNLASVARDVPLMVTGLSTSMIPNRISQLLNLRGPSEHYDTACSSSLVALHRAIQSIERGECEQAIVGAVNLVLTPAGFIGFESLGYLSPEGKAASFQADASGFVRAEGVGVVLLKPARKAIGDGNRIHAVIKGTGVSHGGSGVSMTTPNGTGMREAIRKAIETSGVDPATISYIEAHGIANPLGDAIEISALKAEYPSASAAVSETPCYVGSIKPCIGYPEVASGMAALLKTVLALRYRIVPGIPRFTVAHENISLKNSRFRMTAENHEWRALKDSHGRDLPRRAAINNYGFSGVNAHLILEEYVPSSSDREMPSTASSTGTQAFVFSAKTPERLRACVEQFAEFVDTHADVSLADLAYTLQVGRDAMNCRLAVLVIRREELIDVLKNYLAGVHAAGTRPSGIFEDDGTPAAKIDDETLEHWMRANRWEDLASHWVHGGKVSWEKLHVERRTRLSLPGYPLEPTRFWIDGGTGLASLHRQSPSVECSTDDPVIMTH